MWMHWPLAVLHDAVTLCVRIHTSVGPTYQRLLVPTVCVCSAAQPHRRSRPHLALDAGTSCSNGKCCWHCYVADAASVSQECLCLYDIVAQRHQRLTPHLAVAAQRPCHDRACKGLPWNRVEGEGGSQGQGQGMGRVTGNIFQTWREH